MICASTTSLATATAAPPSEWIQRFAHLLPAQARVLDVACGSGRHAVYLTQLGHQVTGLDRNTEALAQLPSEVTSIEADIENGPWPLAGQQFDAVIVTNYLWRALWPRLLSSVREGGVLLYETFAPSLSRLEQYSKATDSLLLFFTLSCVHLRFALLRPR